jgi:cation diffusion facilitator CzcD-associated flavoprotein CzcO
LPSDTEEQKKQFKSDPDLHHKYRKDLEYEISTRFKFACLSSFSSSLYLMALQAILNSPDQKAAFEMSKNIMIEKLAKKPHLIDQIVPDFAVGCRRPTPGLGFLEALCEDNTDLVNSKIVRMTEKGILTADGVEHELDM